MAQDKCSAQASPWDHCFVVIFSVYRQIQSILDRDLVRIYRRSPRTNIFILAKGHADRVSFINSSRKITKTKVTVTGIAVV